MRELDIEPSPHGARRTKRDNDDILLPDDVQQCIVINSISMRQYIASDRKLLIAYFGYRI